MEFSSQGRLAHPAHAKTMTFYLLPTVKGHNNWYLVLVAVLNFIFFYDAQFVRSATFDSRFGGKKLRIIRENIRYLDG